MTWRWSGQPGSDLRDAVAAAVQMVQPQAYLEVGVDCGQSLITALETARDIRQPLQRIVLCDIWNPEYCGHGFTSHAHIVDTVLRPYGATENVTFLDGDSKKLVPMLQEKFDLITIDASHKTADAVADLNNCWPLLNVGGLLVFDDILLAGYFLGPAFDLWSRKQKDLEHVREESGCANTAIVRKREP